MAKFRDPKTGRYASASTRKVIVEHRGRRVYGKRRAKFIREAKKLPKKPPKKLPKKKPPKKKPSVRRVAPGTFPKGYDTPFRKFITPVRFMKPRVRRLAYVLVELADTDYKTDSGKNLIIPLRLGQFTKRELLNMSPEERDERASSWMQWNQVTRVHGVYVRR